MEQRKYKRFSATAFLNRPITVTPIPPYIGRPIKGKLIDLSAGGISILINQIIPQDALLHLTMTFPDHAVLESDTRVKHAMPRDRHYLHGLEFMNLDPVMVDRINRMSNDYIDCETRIRNKAAEVCKGADCAFYTMCNKSEKKDLVLDVETSLTLAFRHLKDKVCAKPE